jgi:hypothetical protein
MAEPPLRPELASRKDAPQHGGTDVYQYAADYAEICAGATCQVVAGFTGTGFPEVSSHVIVGAAGRFDAS